MTGKRYEISTRVWGTFTSRVVRRDGVPVNEPEEVHDSEAVGETFHLPADVGEGLLDALPRTLAVFHPNDDPEGAYFNRWLRKGPHEHVYCALGHLASYLRGRKDEDHLALASARLLLAIARETVE